MAGQEQVCLEEERSRILARVDDLKHRVTELEQQLQETKQEVSVHTHTLHYIHTHTGDETWSSSLNASSVSPVRVSLWLLVVYRL